MTTTTLKEWEMKLYHGLPVILGFAIIGMIVFLGGIVYFTYRNFRNTRRREAEKDKEQEEGSAVPYLAITSPPPAKGFVPIHTSLHLVPREEILNDPARRHGVDEVKLWEQRQQEKPFWKFMTDYPDSPESIKTEIEQPMNRSVSEVKKYSVQKTHTVDPNFFTDHSSNQYTPSKCHLFWRHPSC